MIDFKKCNEEDLWKYVASALQAEGIESILVGGACVSVYSKGIYKSGDIDMIINSVIFKDKVPGIMKSLGFERKGRYFKHPECDHLFVEFPTGPVHIGGGDVDLETKEVNGKALKILSPTDCIIDRLESYIYGENAGVPHGERKTLEQAVLVAKNQYYNPEKIKAFCEKVGKAEVFAEFKELLES
jgi:hypothetical protein